jgi:hypothetical protein
VIDIRTEQIAIRLTTEEFEECAAAAKGRALAEWARPFVLKGARGPSPFETMLFSEQLVVRQLLIYIANSLETGEPITEEQMDGFLEAADRTKIQEALNRFQKAGQ